jgi:hypothetical protein
MNCVHCKKPITRYPAFSEHDPEWVHLDERGWPGSQYCEDNNHLLLRDRKATPEPRIQEVPNV